MTETPFGDADMWELLDAAPDGVVACDRQGVIVFCNRQAEQLFRVGRMSLLGTAIEDLLPTELRERHLAHRRSYSEHPVTRPMGQGSRLLARRRDGTTFPVDIALSPVHLDSGPFVMASIRDVTERLALEAEREVAIAEARAAETLLVERERMAGELHDTVIQHLFSIGLSLQSVSARVDPQVAERVLVAVDQIDDAIRELRQSIFRLKSPALMVDLKTELRAVFDEVAARVGDGSVLVLSGPLDDQVVGELRVDLLNTFREALSNVVRHAEATAVHAEVVCEGAELRVRVRDDGVGMGERRLGGNGVPNMADRALRHNGRFEITPVDPSGTVVHWVVPLAPAELGGSGRDLGP